ncbi:sensor histidine kinase [Vallitalea okinawensis]|uniref:sensor histidine kinase n=1 Tax=Vallitalea okinawensis TaxID=2078660 RepID=UPI000CFB9868|nr:HAMP domain-containing sensor histidine kinase [Vallitalea okinawensis]
MMNISLNKVILSFGLGYLFLSICFIIGLITLGVSIQILLYAVVFLILFCMMAVFFMFCVKGKVQKMLIALSLTIQSLIKDEDNDVFTDIEDSMLSKLQSQVTRLSSILKYRNAQIKEEKDSIKSLISDIAHQLKTPLANLNMYESLVLDESIDHGQRMVFLKKLQNQINKLNWLVASLVKLSRLETGVVQLTPKIQSIEDTILTAIRQAYPFAESKGIEIVFDGNPDLKLKHDDKWTAEALFNIIDNAIKYTKNGGYIGISITTYELFARIDISDNGIGLYEHEINHIFKRFYRGEDTEKIDGIGIGLYLAREIITKQGGYIKVKSKKGEGSVFSVFLLVNKE